eukprot:331768-Hanusia_phi.AAC.8
MISALRARIGPYRDRHRTPTVARDPPVSDGHRVEVKWALSRYGTAARQCGTFTVRTSECPAFRRKARPARPEQPRPGSLAVSGLDSGSCPRAGRAALSEGHRVVSSSPQIQIGDL